MRRTRLFFERSPKEGFVIGEGRNEVFVEVTRVLEGRATLTIQAPRHIRVDRLERRVRKA